MALRSERSSMNEGMLWSVWAEKSGLKLLDSDEEPEETIKTETDAMHLKKEDMHLFGQCPTWDEFYLVVCNICNTVVKPQAFKHHIELRHANAPLSSQNETSQTKPLVNKSKGSSTTMPLVPSSSGKSSKSNNAAASLHRSSNSSKSNGSPSGGPTSKHKSSGKKTNTNNNNHLITPVVRVERMPENMMMVSASASHGNGALNMERKLPTPQQPPPPLSDPPPATSIANNIMATSNVAKMLLNSSPGPPSSPAYTVKSSSPSSSSSSTASSAQPPVKKSSSSSRSRKVPKEKKLVLCKDREYDPNKHCGVITTDLGKPCTRSLTCKSHNLSSRRNVAGREKHFDQLLADHKASKESPRPTSPSTSSPSPSCSKNSILQVLPTNRASSSSLSQSSSATKSAITPPSPSSSIPNDRPTTTLKEEAPSLPSPSHSSDRASPPCPSPIVYKVEAGDPPYITHFPRPAAVCAFGMRQLSSGFYLLDRRFDFQAAKLQKYQFLKPNPVHQSSPSTNSSSVNKKPTIEVLSSSHKSQPVKKEEDHSTKISESPDKATNPPPSKKKKLVPNGTACSGPNAMPPATLLPLKFPLSIGDGMGALSRFQLPSRKELVNGHLVHSLTVNRGYCVQPLMADSSPLIRTENNSPLMPAVSSPSLMNGIGPYHKSNSHSHDIGPLKGKGTSRNSTVQKISAVGSVLTSPAFTLTTATNNNYPHHPVLTNHSVGYKLLAPNQDSRTLNQGSYLPS